MNEVVKEVLTTKKWTKSKVDILKERLFDLKERLFDLKEKYNIDISEPKSLVNSPDLSRLNDDLNFTNAGKVLYFWWDTDDDGKDFLVMTYYDLNVKGSPDYHVDEPSDEQIAKQMKWIIK